MSKSIFLSHNSEDKSFARKLGYDLQLHGIKVWIDEAEIKIGDSIVDKISEGLQKIDYLAVVLSPNSVNAPWVKRELNSTMHRSLGSKQIKILPILYKQCDIPILLEDIKYCDFSNDETYLEKLKELVQDIGVVFNKSALFMDRQEPNLGEAVDLAINYNLPIFRTPFHRPFQYIGMRVSDVAKTLNITPNEAGNLIIESDECRMVLWAEGGFVGYVDISIIKTMPCCLAKEFDSAPLLGSLSINPAELDFARRKTHHHTYYDHKRKLKISVSCPDSGMPLTVAFSAKYYGD